MKPRIEIMRRCGTWVPSGVNFPNAREVYRFAAALGRWIENPRGNVAAVRIKHTMSWSINVTGTLSGVRQKLESDKNIPPGIKSDLLAIIDEPNARTDGITIKGSGHAGGGYGYINELKTERVQLELAPAPLPDLPPAASTETAAPVFPEGNPLKAS